MVTFLITMLTCIISDVGFITVTYLFCRNPRKVQHKREMKAMTLKAAQERDRVHEETARRSSLLKDAYDRAMNVFDD